jgi:hypothetical protein
MVMMSGNAVKGGKFEFQTLLKQEAAE